MEITALATSATPLEKEEVKLYGTVFYEDELGKVIMYMPCFSKNEYQKELAHAIGWAESEPSAVGVRGVPVGGVA